MRTLVEVDEFTADVNVPEAGDARTADSVVDAFQALANRSKNADARATVLEGAGNTVALFTIGGAGLEDEDPITYTASDLGDGFTLSDSDSRIVVPSAGLYRLSVTAYGHLNSALDFDDDDLQLKLFIGSTPSTGLMKLHGMRTLLSAYHHFVGTTILPVADPATDKIALQFVILAHTSRTITFEGVLTLEKLSAPAP